MTADYRLVIRFRLLAGKVPHSEAEVTQDSSQGAFRNIASALGNSGKASVHGGPPDFMRARGLSHKLAAQFAEFLGQHAVGHTGTTSSA